MFWSVTMSLLEGLWTSIELFLLTLLFSLPLGLVVAFGSMSRWAPIRSLLKRCPKLTFLQRIASRCPRLADFRPVSSLTNVIVWIIRGTPLMLQLIIIFYGPGMWFDNNIWAFGNGRMVACVVAFVFNYACYFSVIYRGGIEGVPQGQREAGEVLGMTKSQIFFKITLLQVIKRIVPPMSNEIITLVKDTSLARIIAITELVKAGEAYMKSDGITWPLFYTMVYYLLFVGILTILFNRLEKKLDYFM
ncbi:MAG: amino acid ABC transporter permease [Lachnospiraceae bacterium]|nr:amino acid ABC transporter permease [Lachnospiraceae bacterium]